jgi:hypothetical protein
MAEKDVWLRRIDHAVAFRTCSRPRLISLPLGFHDFAEFASGMWGQSSLNSVVLAGDSEDVLYR